MNIDSEATPLVLLCPAWKRWDTAATVIAISTGVEDAEALEVPVDVGQRLLACYDALGEE